MPEADREAVTTVFANLGKAIAAYERTILPPHPTAPDPLRRLDRVRELSRGGPSVRGRDRGPAPVPGRGECVNCHNGPLLTDNHFHNTGVPAAPGLPEDTGRLDGARLVLADEFNCLGPYSDAEPEECSELRFMAEPGHHALRAFETPSLRGAASRPPDMHAGQIGTLDGVLDHHAAAPAAPEGHGELRPKALADEEPRQIVVFLASLEPAPEGRPHASPVQGDAGRRQRPVSGTPRRAPDRARPSGRATSARCATWAGAPISARDAGATGRRPGGKRQDAAQEHGTRGPLRAWRGARGLRAGQP